MTRNEIATKALLHLVEQNIPDEPTVYYSNEKGEVYVYLMFTKYTFTINFNLFQIYEQCLKIWKANEVVKREQNNPE